MKGINTPATMVLNGDSKNGSRRRFTLLQSWPFIYRLETCRSTLGQSKNNRPITKGVCLCARPCVCVLLTSAFLRCCNCWSCCIFRLLARDVTFLLSAHIYSQCFCNVKADNRVSSDGSPVFGHFKLLGFGVGIITAARATAGSMPELWQGPH